MLQLTRHDGFAVKVGNFLDLKSALKGGRELETTAKKQERLLVLEDPTAEILDSSILLKDIPNLAGDLGKALHDFLSPLSLGRAILAEREGKHDHGDELGGVSLGGSDTNLRTGVNVDTAVGEERDGRTDDVDDTDGESTTLETVPQGHEGVGGFTRLGDEDASVITEDGGLSVKEIRGKLDSDGDLDELLEDTTDSHARVVAGTACNEYYPPASTDGGNVRSETTEGHSLVGDVETTTHGVDDGLGLLENLLLHEVVELALHDLLELELEGLDGPHIGASIGLLKAVNVEGALVNVGNVVILEVQDLLGVFDNGGGIRRQEELRRHGHTIISHEGAGLRPVEERLVGGCKAGTEKSAGVVLDRNVMRGSFGREGGSLLRVLDVDEVDLHPPLRLDANDERGTLTSSNNFMGIMHRLDQQAVSALKLLDDGLGKIGEANALILVIEILGKLSNALGIGLGLELEALAGEEGLQLLVVGDDTIVNNGELPGRVGPAL